MHAKRTIAAVAPPLVVTSSHVAELAAKPGSALLDFESEFAGQ